MLVLLVEDSDLQIVVKDKEVAYWEKAETESRFQIEKLESALKFERATLEMILEHLQEAKQADVIATSISK